MDFVLLELPADIQAHDRGCYLWVEQTKVKCDLIYIDKLMPFMDYYISLVGVKLSDSVSK